MNYSEVDCPGLLVRRSGLDTALCPCVITASHFSILALLVFIISGERGLKRRHLCSPVHQSYKSVQFFMVSNAEFSENGSQRKMRDDLFCDHKFTQ